MLHSIVKMNINIFLNFILKAKNLKKMSKLDHLDPSDNHYIIKILEILK